MNTTITELTMEEIVALKVGDKVQIGDTFTTIRIVACTGFITADSFIDHNGFLTTAYITQSQLAYCDIGKIPVYLIIEDEDTSVI